MERFRVLTPGEIEILKVAGNRADHWPGVRVSEDFVCDNIFDCSFGNGVAIDRIDGMVAAPAGTERRAMLSRCRFEDCTIGNGVFVANIGSRICGYDILEGAYVEDCGALVTTGESSFGNGTSVAAVNEGGGREALLSDLLSSQIAYLMVFYRHRPMLVERLRELTENYRHNVASRRGTIGRGAVVAGCRSIVNVNIGSGAILNGAAELSSGTVGSSATSPSYVGAGVVARDFIMTEGARIDTGAIIERCFVGENVRLESGFSAVDTLFFTGSHFANGEACSVFAGPFTVSHHRSSLLIAGLFSFFNAGSGSNQSNHLFKTGPVHQGIHERGCKFASNAYVMLPAREGAFTMVLGRHTSHHDTKDFPFSYLIEDQGKSFLMPGANLRSCGTMRDMAKWPNRDKRSGAKRDQVNFEAWNPYLGERMAQAISRCETLLEQEIDVYSVERVKIRRTMLRRGLELYRKALRATLSHILSAPVEADPAGAGEWVDVAGMLAPRTEIEMLCDRIEEGAFASLSEIQARIEEIHTDYRSYACGWVSAQLKEMFGHEPTAEDVAKCVTEGAQDILDFEKMAADDAGRDGDTLMMVGYGIDLCGEAAQQDFAAVRKKK